MKERIMFRLEDFAKDDDLRQDNAMFQTVAKELNTDSGEIQIRARKVLKHILHNYAFFDIVTIDKFNHRLLRTFAFDLKLPLNFEVVVDELLLLEEATDRLIFNAGTDALLTQILVDYALEKADNDKSWDISRDLYRIAKLLLKEDYMAHIKEIQNVSLKELKSTAEKLKQEIKNLESETSEIARETLNTITQNNIPQEDFTRSSLPNFLIKLSSNDFSVGFNTKWQENIYTDKLYTNKVSKTPIATVIDELQPYIADQHETIKKNIINLRYRQNLLKNLTPLSLLNSINAELLKIKEEENLLLISEFNQIISNEIGTQPAPFIYERLGEKYRHYFIDEFQDTSRMQWENLIPLISNALESQSISGKNGTLMLVGDAKQAIYRWRGGVAEQFINLYKEDGKNPFQIEKHVFSLPRNFRSCEKIIEFNNSFFKHISTFLTDSAYQNLFDAQSKQEFNNRKKGYVEISFVEKETLEHKTEAYCDLTYRCIDNLIKEGKALKDICILTRKKKEGVAIASYLTEKQIPIISSESLLLKNDNRIAFLINLMRHSIQPQNKEIIASVLLFIGEHEKTNIHETMRTYLDNIKGAFKKYDFKLSNFQKLPLNEAVEYAINSFKLQKVSDAYLNYFLDELLAYAIHNNLSFTDFLAFWEKKENSLSIVSPPDANAIKIMTIHKAKGLEFPIVIYPFADSNITEDRDRELWLPVSPQTYGIKTALFTRNKELAMYDDFTAQMCERQEAKLQLDQYNILYVALTRAVERLYIFTVKDISSKGLENTGSYAGLFINYLKHLGHWDDAKNIYFFGEKPEIPLQKNIPHEEHILFMAKNPLKRSFNLITRGGSLWETTRETALEKGNLYHLLLSRVKYAEDLEEILEEALLTGELSETFFSDISQKLLQLINHSKLAPYFTAGYTIYNEYDIYTQNGSIIRPDRLAIDQDNNAVIIDYKTGNFNNTYINQLNSYALAVDQMGFKTEKKLLVFINETIEVKTIS